MKIRRRACQEKAPESSLWRQMKTLFPQRDPNGFYLPGKRQCAHKYKTRKEGTGGEKDKELERDSDERAFLAPRRQ